MVVGQYHSNMANQPEISEFTAGIYQYETTDEIEGGAGGKLNLPWLQLANRTKWLYDRIVDLFKFAPKNRGYFTGLDVAGSIGSLTVSGNITSAIASVPQAGRSIIIVNMANSMGNTNYKVDHSVQSLSSGINTDNNLSGGVFKPISATQFQIAFAEVDNRVQNLRIHLDIISLD